MCLLVLFSREFTQGPPLLGDHVSIHSFWEWVSGRDWDRRKERQFFQQLNHIPVESRNPLTYPTPWTGLICSLRDTDSWPQQTPNSAHGHLLSKWGQRCCVQMLFRIMQTVFQQLWNCSDLQKWTQLLKYFRYFLLWGVMWLPFSSRSKAQSLCLFSPPQATLQRTQTWILKDLANSRAPLPRECSVSRESKHLGPAQPHIHETRALQMPWECQAWISRHLCSLLDLSIPGAELLGWYSHWLHLYARVAVLTDFVSEGIWAKMIVRIVLIAKMYKHVGSSGRT